MEREVQERLESLEGKLGTALRKIGELEEELGAHYGLDYGTTLIDANSPHRNLSVDTIESGGGIILQSEHGQQVKSGNDTDFVPAIYFVRDIVPDPSTSFPLSRIEGRETTTNATLQIASANNDVSFSAVASTSAQSTGGFVTLTANVPGSDIPARVTVTRRADEAYVQVIGPLYLLDLGEDPSSIWGATEEDGMLWYRSGKFRARINGATENLATETLVTDHTGGTSDAHDASAISVDSTTLVGVGTDVQAVLEELDNGIADHLSDTSDAHDASAISVADSGGLLTATDVEAALAEIIGMIPAGGGGVCPVIGNTFDNNSMKSRFGAALAIPATAAWPSANLRIYIPYDFPEDVTIAKLWWYNGTTANANVNMAIYNEDGTRIANTDTGSVAQSGTSVIQEADITDASVTAGRKYISISLDATTGHLFRGVSPVGAAEGLQVAGMAEEASAFTAPATATLAAVSNNYIPLCGFSLRTLVT